MLYSIYLLWHLNDSWNCSMSFYIYLYLHIDVKSVVDAPEDGNWVCKRASAKSCDITFEA